MDANKMIEEDELKARLDEIEKKRLKMIEDNRPFWLSMIEALEELARTERSRFFMPFSKFGKAGALSFEYHEGKHPTANLKVTYGRDLRVYVYLDIDMETGEVMDGGIDCYSRMSVGGNLNIFVPGEWMKLVQEHLIDVSRNRKEQADKKELSERIAYLEGMLGL